MFKLEIRLGNAAMSDAGDIGEVFDDVVRELEAGYTRAAIKDINGNTVGEWSLS